MEKPHWNLNQFFLFVNNDWLFCTFIASELSKYFPFCHHVKISFFFFFLFFFEFQSIAVKNDVISEWIWYDSSQVHWMNHCFVSKERWREEKKKNRNEMPIPALEFLITDNLINCYELKVEIPWNCSNVIDTK